MKLSIVIPVYREEGNITRVLKEINKNVSISNEIIIVYDFEEDPTLAVVKKYVSKKQANSRIKRYIRLLKNNQGSGRGVINAIKSGFKESGGKAVLVVMGDLSDDLRVVDRMFELIDRGYDIVCGSRYMKGGKRVGGSAIKGFMSAFAGLSLHYLFKLPTTDATNAFKMYKKKVVDEIKIESRGGFEYSLEIVVKAFKKGYKIIDVPASWEDRVEGKSKFQILKWFPHYLRWYFYVLRR